MTQAMNLANFSNSLDSSGGVPPTQLNAPVPISKGGTNASTAPAARTNLGSTTVGDALFTTASATAARSTLGVVIGTDVPSPTGTGASGTWNINISGNATTATSATTASSATTAGSVSGIVPVANGGTGTSSGIATNFQTFTASGNWTKPTGGQSMAYIQVWGGGGGGYQYCGAGGGYSELHVPLSYLASTVYVTVGAGGAANYSDGGTSSVPLATAFGGISTVYATGGMANGGFGGSPQGIKNVAAVNDPVHFFGGTAGNGGGSSSSTYGGGSGGTSQAGQSAYGGNGGVYPSLAATAPAGGGSIAQAGARGEVRITCY